MFPIQTCSIESALSHRIRGTRTWFQKGWISYIENFWEFTREGYTLCQKKLPKRKTSRRGGLRIAEAMGGQRTADSPKSLAFHGHGDSECRASDSEICESRSASRMAEGKSPLLVASWRHNAFRIAEIIFGKRSKTTRKIQSLQGGRGS